MDISKDNGEQRNSDTFVGNAIGNKWHQYTHMAWIITDGITDGVCIENISKKIIHNYQCLDGW